jgi:hypothetical protein
LSVLAVASESTHAGVRTIACVLFGLHIVLQMAIEVAPIGGEQLAHGFGSETQLESTSQDTDIDTRGDGITKFGWCHAADESAVEHFQISTLRFEVCRTGKELIDNIAMTGEDDVAIIPETHLFERMVSQKATARTHDENDGGLLREGLSLR